MSISPEECDSPAILATYGGCEEFLVGFKVYTKIIAFEFRIAAWVGRQNVDPTGEWSWPERQYYDEVVQELSDYVSRSYEAVCLELGGRVAHNTEDLGNLTACMLN